MVYYSKFTMVYYSKFTMVYYSKFTMVYYSKRQCFFGIYTTLYHSKYYGLP